MERMKGLKAGLIAQNFKMLHTNATGLPILTNLAFIISVGKNLWVRQDSNPELLHDCRPL